MCVFDLVMESIRICVGGSKFMAKPDEREDVQLSVTMIGDLASALQLASAQRRSCGEDNSEVSGLVEEAVSDWLDKEIHGPPPTPEETEADSESTDTSCADLPVVEFPVVEIPSEQVRAVVDPAVESAAEESTAAQAPVAEAPKVGAGPGRPISGRAVLLIALIAALLGVVSWSVARTTQEPVQEVIRVAPAAITTGVLIIDAQPWAEVERVSNHSGIEVPLPDDRFTPLRLELPPGGYNVSLFRPESSVAETCAVSVTASETIRCMPRQASLDVDRLFKETGWFQ
jgi:hypothetical protein